MPTVLPCAIHREPSNCALSECCKQAFESFTNILSCCKAFNLCLETSFVLCSPSSPGENSPAKGLKGYKAPSRATDYQLVTIIGFQLR
jgi:hypothetical protein